MEKYPESVGKYSTNFIEEKINIPMSKTLIMRALQRYYKQMNKEIKIYVELKNNNMAIINGNKIHYRVTTYTEKSKYPWYSISEKKLDNLDKDCKIVTIFFDKNENSNYPTYVQEFRWDDIKKYWSKSESEGKYRWNPGEQYTSETTKLKRNIGIKGA